jgi:hypothetical protein
VLVVAAAALGEMWTARGNALRGGFQDFDQVGFDMAALFFPDPQAPYFTRQDEGGENSLAIWQTTEGFAAVDKGGGGEDEFLSGFHLPEQTLFQTRMNTDGRGFHTRIEKKDTQRALKKENTDRS